MLIPEDFSVCIYIGLIKMEALCSISPYLFNLAFKGNSEVEAWVNMLHGQTDFSFMLLLFECNQTQGEKITLALSKNQAVFQEYTNLLFKNSLSGGMFFPQLLLQAIAIFVSLFIGQNKKRKLFPLLQAQISIPHKSDMGK